jgi:hypothetical protein
MNHPQLADLPAQVRWLFARALIAELEGNRKQAEALMELAIEWEAALLTPEPGREPTSHSVRTCEEQPKERNAPIL